MKQICQKGFKCPFLDYNDDGEICTYPHMYFWKNPEIRVVIHSGGLGFDVEMLKEYEWTDGYDYVHQCDCPLIEPGSEIDPIMEFGEDNED